MEDDILYEVEKILGVRYCKKRNQVQFLIKWKNYDDRCDNTWEREENLECAKLVQQFWEEVNVGVETKRLIYEGKNKQIILPSAEEYININSENEDDDYEMDGFIIDDDDDDDIILEENLHRNKPKPARSSPLQSKQENRHTPQRRLTREEKGKQPLCKNSLPLPSSINTSSFSNSNRQTTTTTTTSTAAAAAATTTTPLSKAQTHEKLKAEVEMRLGKKKNPPPIPPRRLPKNIINVARYKQRYTSPAKNERNESSFTQVKRTIKKKENPMYNIDELISRIRK